MDLVTYAMLLKKMGGGGGGIADNAGAHNSIYRGKFLGTEVTAEQVDAIGSGKFTDLFIGDYWTIKGYNYRIAGFDYWLHYGDDECTDHHVALVPDGTFGNIKLNSTATTAGAYRGSEFRTGANGFRLTIADRLNRSFGVLLLWHQVYLKNEVTDGYESGGEWVDTSFELMNEMMLFGQRMYGSSLHGTAQADLSSADFSQLPLFALDRSQICCRLPYLLRDVADSEQFVCITDAGRCSTVPANAGCGARPVFAIYAG